MIILGAMFALVSAAAALAQAPAGDYHQHLFSPTVAALISPPPPAAPVEPITARDLIAMLDEAGIRRATVLSMGYTYGNPARAVPDQYEKVKAENDWTSAQVAQFPKRLVGFCGVNPLKDYALAEIARCAKDRNLRRGLKLHMGNSVVDFHNPEHVAQLRRVFAAANANRMAITVHLRTSISQKMPYGGEEARTFLNEVLPAAPDVPVQIAHLAGAGGWGDPAVDQALDVLAKAVAEGDPRTRRLWFDVTTVVTPATTPARAEQVAARIRQVGVKRVLYGSDAASGTNLRPREGWAAFRSKVPLTEAEFRTIARNVPPYMR
jgi:uncharacterized protein